MIAVMPDIVDEAALRTEADAAEAVARAQRALADTGTADCVMCGEEIGADRRRALPSARRCLRCQTARERIVRRGDA